MSSLRSGQLSASAASLSPAMLATMGVALSSRLEYHRSFTSGKTPRYTSQPSHLFKGTRETFPSWQLQVKAALGLMNLGDVTCREHPAEAELLAEFNADFADPPSVTRSQTAEGQTAAVTAGPTRLEQQTQYLSVANQSRLIRNQIFYNVLALMLNGCVDADVMECEGDGYKLWVRVQLRYTPRTELDIHRINAQFNGMQQKPTQPVDKYMDAAKLLRAEVQRAGRIVQDLDFRAAFISGLLPSLATVAHMLLSQNVGLDDMMGSLRNVAMPPETVFGQPGAAVAMNVTRTLAPGKTCHSCKKPGHFARDCPQAQRQTQDARNAGGVATRG